MREWLSLLGRMPPKNNGDDLRWFEQDEGDARLANDRKLIASKYPHLRYALNYSYKTVFLDGYISIKEEYSGIPTKIMTRIIFPHDYPVKEPFAIETGDMFPHINDRHFYSFGGCCLWLPPESQWDNTDSNALLAFLDQAAIFFERQLIFDASGGKSWPWGERGHGTEGYLEYIEEKLGNNPKIIKALTPLIRGDIVLGKKSRCPCNSGKPYQHCHKPIVIHLQEAILDLVQRIQTENKVVANNA